ncbi:hypothetical protein TFLX_04799 [Thermoflexales bacterium]|nr:hypothetical protein TFLX_04799 [Thermoflexales bacterium]
MSTKRSISQHVRSAKFWLTLTFMLALTLGVMPANAAGVHYAKPIASGTGDCLSWDNACALQTALTGATSGNEIWVAAGTHKPTTETDRSIDFQLKSGVALYGGFAGTETARDQRNPALHVTILSGDIDNNDSQAPIITNPATVTGNTTNSYHVVTGATGATLDGFTITAGYGGASRYGGGMYNLASSPALSNVTFSGNMADSGGGMANRSYSNPTLTNVTFGGNSASQGGGMYNNNSNPTLTNVTFILNSAPSGDGGGMDNESSSPTLTNVTFSFNSSSGGAGGGMNNTTGSNPTLTNVTFNGNSANWGGGMNNYNSSNPQIRNTIFWGNTDNSHGAQIYNYNSSTPIVNDSVVQDGCPAQSACTNIIITNPLLGTLGYYGGFTLVVPLQTGSSAINTGNDAVCPATDQRGVSRPQGMHCDIGAYEYQPPDTIPPTVFSITRDDANPTNLTSVDFTVTFSEPVTGVNVTDFTLTTSGISGAFVSGVNGSGSVYTVTASTGSGIGTLRLDVVDDDSIVDMAGNPLGGTGTGNSNFIGGEMYDVRFHLIYLPLVFK